MLGDVEVPRLPDWEEEGPELAPRGCPDTTRDVTDKDSYTYRVYRPGCPAAIAGHRLLRKMHIFSFSTV